MFWSMQTITQLYWSKVCPLTPYYTFPWLPQLIPTTRDPVRTLNIVCGNYWRHWRRVPGSSLEVFVPAQSRGRLPEAAEKYPRSAAEGPTNRKANRCLRWRWQEGPALHTRDKAGMENENVWGVHSEEHLCFFPLCFFCTPLLTHRYMTSVWVLRDSKDVLISNNQSSYLQVLCTFILFCELRWAKVWKSLFHFPFKWCFFSKGAICKNWPLKTSRGQHITRETANSS